MANQNSQLVKADDMTQWAATDTERPWTVNEERRWHFYKRATMVKDARIRWCYLWKLSKIPKLDQIDVEVEPILKNWRSAPDAVACAGTVKAAIDALVDIKIIADDSAKYVRSVRFWAPTIGETQGLRLTVREVVRDRQARTNEATKIITPTPVRGDLA